MNIIKNLKKTNLRRAFTMSEVMITLGIIGIVAAITLPVLIHNANSKKFTAQFKKSISTLSQVAVTTNAKYDVDYGSITTVSFASTCADDKIVNEKASMCAMLNQTLSGATYVGTYDGPVGKNPYTGAMVLMPYKIRSIVTAGFTPTNFLLYSLADNSLVGFNPAMRNCHLTQGRVLNTEVLKATINDNGLNECIGFVDVNGQSGPNKEVTCIDGKAAFSGSPCPLKKGGISEDVFPVVFHDGKAEPATNAARAVLMNSASKDGFFDGSTGD